MLATERLQEEDAGIPFALRHIPPESFPLLDGFVQGLQATPNGQEFIEMLGLDRTEAVMAIDLPEETWRRLLASGRLPQPGAREVLAGDLVRLANFALDGERFEVVGRLRRGVPGFIFAYALPADPAVRHLFTEEAGTTAGWIYPDGPPPAPDGDETPENPAFAAPLSRTGTGTTLAVILGLVAVAVGGATLQVRVFRWLGGRRCGAFTPVLAELRARPVLLAVVHALSYGPFFLYMLAALVFPLENLFIHQFLGETFQKGDLSYIGAAYDSGNILQAAAATFFHNFVIATVGWAILPSFLIPFAGVLKNTLSFAVVGFGLAPMWTGVAAGYTYHAITMTLELEAYVIASFTVSVLAIRAGVGLARWRFAVEYARGALVMLSGTLLVGLMLALAALYEATTLILFQLQ